MAVTALKAVLYAVVPISLVILFSLLLPLRGRVRRVVNGAVNRVFLLPVISNVPLVAVLLGSFSIFFLVRTMDVSNRMSDLSREVANGEVPRISITEYKLVRSQRDFWISLVLFVTWGVLWRLLSLSQHIVSLQEEVEALRNNKPTVGQAGLLTTTATAPSTASTATTPVTGGSVSTSYSGKIPSTAEVPTETAQAPTENAQARKDK
jgi:hypothetical protein